MLSNPPGRMWINIEGFYADDERRRRSGEVDYGVMWTTDAYHWPRYRVSYVIDTGELYALCLSHGPVELLGVFIDREACERALAGWAEACGEPHSLEWVRRRAREHGVPVDTEA